MSSFINVGLNQKYSAFFPFTQQQNPSHHHHHHRHHRDHHQCYFLINRSLMCPSISLHTGGARSRQPRQTNAH